MSKPTYLVILTTENTRQIDAIVRAVQEISEPTDARIVIVHVFTQRTYQRALSELDEEPKSALEKRFTEQIPAHPGTEDDVPEWVKHWSQQQIRGAVGDPVDHILRMIEEADADFVVLSVRGWSDVRQVLLSSVAQKTLRLAPCPVLSVREPVYE